MRKGELARLRPNNSCLGALCLHYKEECVTCGILVGQEVWRLHPLQVSHPYHIDYTKTGFCGYAAITSSSKVLFILAIHSIPWEFFYKALPGILSIMENKGNNFYDT